MKRLIYLICLLPFWAIAQPKINSTQVTAATNSEIINTSHIATWGDSLTEGLGAYDATYPNGLATLSGYTVYNGGKGGQNSTQILARQIAATDKTGWITVIWVGKNDIIQGVSTATIEANIASMIALLTTPKYVIIGITKSSADVSGSANAIKINTINSDLLSAYGATHFLDENANLLTHGNGSGTDNAAIATGNIPPSLMSDAIHLNKAGYAYVSSDVLSKLTPLLTTSANIITAASSPALSTYPLDQYSVKTGGMYQIGGEQILYRPNYTTNANSMFVGNGGGLLTTGNNNTSNGYNALINITSGLSNTAAGAAALYTVATANNNTAIGASALYLTTGSGNTGIGSSALFNNAGGADNVAIGFNALNTNTSGQQNVAIGQAAALYNSSALGLTAVGYHALLNATASNNTGIGTSAGSNITTGTQNLAVGDNIDIPTATVSGQINIKNAIYGTGHTTTGSNVSSGNLGLFVKSPSARLHLIAGSTAASSSPLKFTSGALQTTAEVGAIEFLTDRWYATITTGAARKTFAWTTDIASYQRLTASGTGAATTISIAHGLSGVTSSSNCFVTAKNAASAGVAYVTTDATNINIIYSVAPVSGTNNLSYDIEIKP